MLAEIVLDQVSKVYPGGVLAVDDVSLTIGSGEFIERQHLPPPLSSRGSQSTNS